MARLLSLCALPLLLSAVGCGTTALSFKPTDAQVNLAIYNSVTIQTSNGRSVAVSESVQNRIRGVIRSQLLECCKDRFENISLGDPGPKDLLLHVRFTIYDEGSRFARFMLAGLGSMQIHADVEIKDAMSGNILSGGEAGKTFAWGGVYGAVTGIEDLETDFAKEVVNGFRKALGIGP